MNGILCQGVLWMIICAKEMMEGRKDGRMEGLKKMNIKVCVV